MVTFTELANTNASVAMASDLLEDFKSAFPVLPDVAPLKSLVDAFFKNIHDEVPPLHSLFSDILGANQNQLSQKTINAQARSLYQTYKALCIKQMTTLFNIDATVESIANKYTRPGICPVTKKDLDSPALLVLSKRIDLLHSLVPQAAIAQALNAQINSISLFNESLDSVSALPITAKIQKQFIELVRSI